MVAHRLTRSDWLQNFQVPKNFSGRTMLALSNGEKSNITSAVRREIIASVATLVMVHVNHPTPDEYTGVCEQLIKEYPILADSFGCGFVSLSV